jgi:DNA-binding MarR family transcriptional regulator
MDERNSSGNRSEMQDEEGLESALGRLAQFRYALRKFLHFSEDAARSCGITPQQHQLMLGVAGFTGRGSATISELAEFLQERNHSVVELTERAVRKGIVTRTQDAEDRRVVNVSLTRRGEGLLADLTRLHQGEARRVRGLWETCEFPTPSRGRKKKGV